MKISWFYLVMVAVLMTACHPEKKIKVLQFNIWQEGTIVENGFSSIVQNIKALDPDLVTFSEVRNYNGVSFIPHLLSELEKLGVKYYGEESVSTGIISKYKIKSQEVVYPLKNDRGSVIKANIQINGQSVVLYSAHLDWMHCAYYLPRGYASSTWKKMDGPIVNVDSILSDNRASFRDDEVRSIIEDAQRERSRGSIVLIGGDFNEPSHLDWQEETKNIRDHHGTVINWDCSMMLQKAGFKDAFRQIYPNPVLYPGFTFPANNAKVETSKLSWSPEADDRERIDFIYYYPCEDILLKNAKVVGPEGSVLYGKRTDKDLDSQDSFLLPEGGWPTDHKALLVTFVLK